MKTLHRRTVSAVGLAASLLVAQSAAAQLYLPFTGGRTLTITQYPHRYDTVWGPWAMDIGMPLNEPIWASASGTVRVAGYDGNPSPGVNGLQVIIDHGNDFCTQYNHLNWVNVRR